MRGRLIVIGVLVWIAAPACVQAQDARSILEKVREQQVERWEGVTSYVVDQSIAGTRTQMYYARVEVTDPEGGTVPVFRLMTPDEVARVEAGENVPVRSMTPETLQAYAGGLEMTGEAMGEEIEDGLEDAGLPRGLLSATGSDPWATLDPRVMMGGMAMGLRAMAVAPKDGPDPAAEARDDVAAVDALMNAARLVGKENVDDRDAFHLSADGLSQTQEVNGETFTIEAVDMWIDTEAYVPLRFEMKGVARSGGESRPITIEKHDMDYRAVPGSKMYEPRKQVMRIAGVMDDEQQAKMREAQEKLEEFERQMAQMPEVQRRMIMNRMGSQMEAIKKMASGGGFEVVTEVHEIRVIG